MPYATHLGLHESPARVICAGGYVKNRIWFWRNFLEVKLQRSGGVARIVRGFVSANDTGGKFVQAHWFAFGILGVSRFIRPCVPLAGLSVSHGKSPPQGLTQCTCPGVTGGMVAISGHRS